MSTRKTMCSSIHIATGDTSYESCNPIFYMRPLTFRLLFNHLLTLPKQSEQEQERECIVLPPVEKGGRLGLIINYEQGMTQTEYYSHKVKTIRGEEHNVRLMVKIRETSKLIDPLDFRYHKASNREGALFYSVRAFFCSSLAVDWFVLQLCDFLGFHQAIKDGSWHNVNFVGHCYMTNKGCEFEEHDIQSKEFIHYAENFEVDFPSIVFVYLPDDGKALYDRIKIMSNL
jgi:hypothetical protein